MRSSVVVDDLRAPAPSRAPRIAATNSSVIGCGNLGAPPKPPRCSSNACRSRENAARVISSVSGSLEALSSPTRAMCSAIFAPCVDDLRRAARVHASAIAAQHLRERRQPVLRHGGKYVPAKNGLPSGVRNAVRGHPPLPVIAWAASM